MLTFPNNRGGRYEGDKVVPRPDSCRMVTEKLDTTPETLPGTYMCPEYLGVLCLRLLVVKSHNVSKVSTPQSLDPVPVLNSPSLLGVTVQKSLKFISQSLNPSPPSLKRDISGQRKVE